MISCGVNKDKGGDDGPPAGANGVVGCAVRREIGHITDRFEQADRRAKAAETVADREAAEAERQAVLGEFWAAGEGLADLQLLLLRYAVRHRPEELRALLAEVLRPDLDELADAVAGMEARR